MRNKLFCPICVKESNKSTVFIGLSMTTLMCTQEYYDEDGKYHFHNPNTITTEYSCSNGHKFTNKDL